MGARGTFGAQSGVVDAVVSSVELSGSLYIGTEDSGGVGSVYTWSKTSTNSFALKFQGVANDNTFGSISFVRDQQAYDANGRQGTFIFSNPVSLSTGAFDFAEDFPTYDTTLESGDIVAIDPDNIDFVKKADGTTPAIGIYSTNPGLLLQKPKDVADTGETWIPIALVGRVPLKVTTENGPIKAGDSLTLSIATPGTAMKATKAGTIIARALGGYSGEAVGTVSAFIDNSYSTGAGFANILNSVETVGEGGAITLDRPTYSAQKLLAQFMTQKVALIKSTALVDILADRIAAGLEVITPTLIADEVQTNIIRTSTGKNIGLVLGADGKFTIGGQTTNIITNPDGTTTTTTTNNPPAITFDSTGNANFAGKLTAPLHARQQAA